MRVLCACKGAKCTSLCGFFVRVIFIQANLVLYLAPALTRNEQILLLEVLQYYLLHELHAFLSENADAAGCTNFGLRGKEICTL